MSGKLSKAASGLNALCEENNEQGAAEHGRPAGLSGKQSITDKEARAKVGKGLGRGASDP